MPAATGGLRIPKAVGFRCAAIRSSPELRAGPSGLWQWAQLISSQARARTSSVPLWGSSQTASRGASAGDGAPTIAPRRLQWVSWFSVPSRYAKSRLRCRAFRPIGIINSPVLWQPLHWLLLGMMSLLVRAAVGVDPAHVDGVAGDVEGRLGLGDVPDGGQADPAVGRAPEDP